jgi:hypothetical protein
MPAFLTLALCSSDALFMETSFRRFFFVPEISNKCAATRRVRKRKRIKNESEHNNARDRDMRAAHINICKKSISLFTCVSSSSACVGIKRTRGQRDRCVCWLLLRDAPTVVYVSERENAILAHYYNYKTL